MSAIVLRKARAACERELRATIAWMIDNRRSLALLAKERVRAIRIAFFELQRRFFRGFVKAAERLTARLR